MKFRSLVSALVLGLLVQGCLMTRSDVEEAERKKEMQSQISTMQKTRADSDARLDQIESEIRKLTGALETSDHRMSTLSEKERADNEGLSKKLDDILAQMKIFEENISKITQKQNELTNALAAAQNELNANAKESSSGKSEGKESKKSHLKDGDEYFDKKDWKKAIGAYSKYRDASPKGGEYAKATYRIGVSFQELGLKAEARAFFEEVIEKYPKDGLAKKAQFRLNQIKK